MPHREGVPTIEIQLGGQTYTLGWTWGAKRRVQEILKARHSDPQNVDRSETLAAALWASLDEDNRKTISVEDVEEMIHPGNEMLVMQKMNDLLEASEPKPNPEGKVEPAATKKQKRKPTAGKSDSISSVQSASST